MTKTIGDLIQIAKDSGYLVFENSKILLFQSGESIDADNKIVLNKRDNSIHEYSVTFSSDRDFDMLIAAREYVDFMKSKEESGEMNKEELKEFIDSYWEDVADDIEEVMVAGLNNSVSTGEICVSAEVVSRIAYQGLMRLIDQYEMTTPLKADVSSNEDEHIYLLYDWRDREILCQTHSKMQAYAKIGEMSIDGEEIDDIHIITLNSDGVEE